MSTIRAITELEFRAADPFYRVLAHEHSRRFASVSLAGDGGREVAISWQSDMIQPLIRRSQDGTALWIAVDQGVVELQCPNGGIAFALRLPSNVLDLQLYNDLTIVVCETHLILVNQDASIRSLHGLPEIPDSVQRIGEQLHVSYLDGETEQIRL